MASRQVFGDRAERPASVAAWPLLLIGLGVLLLAANVGWLGWDALLRLGFLVPLAMVAVGADILLRGRHRLLVVLATLVAAALLYAGQSNALGFAGLGATTPAPESVSQSLMGAGRAEVTLRSGVAELRVSGGAASGLLAEGTIRPLRGERIERTFALAGGVARLTLESQGRVAGFSGARAGLWELGLSGEVPLELSVDTGVGEAVLDLAELQLTRLALNTGVGASTVILPPAGSYEASISTGVGAASVRLPASLPARITVARGLGGIAVPADFERDGDVYTSPGFAAATERVELHVSSGVGLVDIDLIDIERVD